MASAEDQKALYELKGAFQSLSALVNTDRTEARESRHFIHEKLDNLNTVAAIFQTQIDKIQHMDRKLVLLETADAEVAATLVRTVTRVEEIDRDVSKLGGTIDSVLTWRESFYPEPASSQKKRAIGLVSGASIVTFVALVQWWNEVTQFFKGFGR